MLATWVQLAGQADPADVPGWIYMLVTLAVGGAGTRYYFARVEKRLKSAEVSKVGADARLGNAQAEEIEERLRVQLMQDVEVAMQREREKASAAEADAAEAVAELARLVAEHARDRSEWKDERHDLVNKIAALEKENVVLRRD